MQNNTVPATFALPTLANLSVPVVPAAALVPAQPAPAKRKAASKETYPCRCGQFVGRDGERTGCQARTARTFAPGHDAKAKGLFLRAALSGDLVRDEATGRTYEGTDAAGLFGFRELVLASLAKAQAKEAARLGLVPAAAPVAESDDADTESDDAGDLAAQVAAEEAAYAAKKAAEDAAAEAEFAAAAPAPAKRTRRPRNSK